MKTSAEGRKALMLREGFKTKAYKDTKGIWTIGVGHTSAAGPPEVTPGLVLSEAQVSELFAHDLVQYEKAVNDSIHVALTQNQFDACVSLCYNIGTGGFSKSSVVKRINGGDTVGAADAFLMWNKPAVLIGRRKSERGQFLTPDPKPLVEASEKAQEAPKPLVATGTSKTTDKPPVTLLGLLAKLFGRKEPA